LRENILFSVSIPYAVAKKKSILWTLDVNRRDVRSR
jgi:hypothetical protein